MSMPAVKKLKTDIKRLDGMQRELYSLLGENTPPTQVRPDRFKSKPNWKQKPSPWQRVPFENKARKDNLELRHWTRGQPDPDEPYKFAQFDTQIDIPQWTDDDYALFKRDNWTIEETQYLFDLCRMFDLRWLVILDRYTWPARKEPDTPMGSNEMDLVETETGGASEAEAKRAADSVDRTSETSGVASGLGSKESVSETVGAIKPEETKPAPKADSQKSDSKSGFEKVGKATSALDTGAAPHPSGRTVEDLKERFYEVSSALLRKSDNLSPADEELLEQMAFPKEREIQRKAHLQRLLSRSPAEVAEEEALVLESRKLEALAERMLQERNKIVQLLDTPPSTGSIAAYQSSQGVAQLHQQLLAEKSRRPKETTPASNSGSVSGSSGRKEERRTGIAAQIIQKRLTSKEEAAYGVSYHDRHTQGVYLRTAKLSTIKQSTAAKAQAIFNEIGLPVRPVMPTAKVAAKHDSLQQSIAVLLEAKKVQDRLETEIRVLKAAKADPKEIQEEEHPEERRDEKESEAEVEAVDDGGDPMDEGN